MNEEKTKLYGGTGLGLAICKGLVDKMNGEIRVESEVNKGAAFYFNIPYAKVENDEDSIASEKIEEKEFKEPVVLIVEDDLTSYNYLDEILSDARINCIHAKSGKEAIELFNQNIRIDLILMDIQLPEMDGYQVTKLIREKNKKIPIIAQTAYAFPADKEKALKAGCNDYISKPIDKDLLLRLLDKYLI